MITLGLGSSGSNVSNTNFTYDNRLGETDHDWLSSATETITWLKGNHNYKAGAYVEYMQNNEARGGLWMGQFNFSRNTNNPLDTNYAYSNLLLGVFGPWLYLGLRRSRRQKAFGSALPIWLTPWRTFFMPPLSSACRSFVYGRR